MNKNLIGKSLKIILIAGFICCILMCLYGFPMAGKTLVEVFPECASWYVPWLIFTWAMGIPCFAVLFIGWKIVKTFNEDRVFTHENSNRLRKISHLSIGDAAFLIMGNFIFLLLNMNHPSVFIISLGIALLGVVIFVICQGIAFLTDKAAELQEQSDWTI